MSTSPAFAHLDREVIAARQHRLDEAALMLRTHFVGIDRIVEELVDAVRVWYVAPELVTRPVIVNLWGMTGVGKTDLVRRLVDALDLADRFVEFELSNSDGTSWARSVAARLEDAGAVEGRPTLLLFDEIQRFRTIDNDGDPVPSTRFTDFWELLSDGRLARRSSPDLDYLLTHLTLTAQEHRRAREAGETVDSPTVGVWAAQQLKQELQLSGDLAELSQLTHEEALRRAETALATKRVYAPIDCTRCLVVVSGNLDDAFPMAGQGSDADVDADTFAAMSRRVTMVDIKDALLKRFTPEQVARFGNTHLVYSSLRRRDFETLITREVERVCDSARAAFGIEVAVDKSVHRLIYRNGVFPVQGVRPVLSSVTDILESNLGRLLFEAVLADEASVGLRYDERHARLLGTVGDRVVTLRHSGRIDAIRAQASADEVANVAVHEAGHALLLALELGLAPLQLTARVASAYAAGFTTGHAHFRSAAGLLTQVRIALAGGLAEEVVFGPELASVGRESDRARATELVVDYVRKHGFAESFTAYRMLPGLYAMGTRGTDVVVEAMMARLADEARASLEAHRDALVALACALAEAGSLPAATVVAVLAEHGVTAQVHDERHREVPPYRRLLDAEAAGARRTA